MALNDGAVEGVKLSTAKIRELMATWLKDPQIRKRLEHYVDVEDYEDRVANPTNHYQVYKTVQEYIDNATQRFGLKPGLTAEDANAKIWDMWCNPAGWKRSEKRKLGDCYEDYLEPPNGFMLDFAGDHDPVLCGTYAGHREAEKCIYRLFEHDIFGDNYRLEVVTTPDDSHVIGWVIVEDLGKRHYGAPTVVRHRL